MKVGEKVFEIHLEKVKKLMSSAASEGNPAAFLFANDLRTPAFMLQACARIFSKIYDSPTLEKLKEDFKLIEDTLGAIDYYTASIKQMEAILPAHIIAYFSEKVLEKTALLNTILEENKWLNGEKLNAIEYDLSTVDWENDRKEIKKFYLKSIEKIEEFVQELDFQFTDLELHVHELRRKLRWLSIYPQALQGLYVFEEMAEPVPTYLQKYLTESVLKSPFNVLPTTINFEKLLNLEKGHYLALSWMISELGKIKDAGLQIEIVKEAIVHTEKLSQQDAHLQAEKLFNKDTGGHINLRTKAEEISKTFFQEEILRKILID